MSPMKWGQLLLCGWPGLAHLWLRGRLTALAVAICFSVVLNMAIATTFLWPAVLGDVFAIIAWPVIVLVWVVSGWTSLALVEKLSQPPKMASELERSGFSSPIILDAPEKNGTKLDQNRSHSLFNRAQSEYLKGHWTQAETILKQRLEVAERDIEARLLLATLFRRSCRWDLAMEQLLLLQRFDDAVHWNWEIARESELIAGSRRGGEADHVRPLQTSDSSNMSKSDLSTSDF